MSVIIKRYIIYSKIKFIINIINITEIYLFYFYDNRHTFTNITFTKKKKKNTYFININIIPVVDLRLTPHMGWNRLSNQENEHDAVLF
jgi:hypothetical protein